MRDLERIDVIIQKISELWKEVPDMRFFQLIHALSYAALEDHDIEDLFYLEDEHFIRTLNRCLESRKTYDC